jgi:streptomycin 6-kinase
VILRHAEDLLGPLALKALRLDPRTRDWLEALPGRVRDLSEAWSLGDLEVLHQARSACVLRARRDGRGVVLKVSPDSLDVVGRATSAQARSGAAPEVLASQDDALLLVQVDDTPVVLPSRPTPSDLARLADLLKRLHAAPVPPGLVPALTHQGLRLEQSVPSAPRPGSRPPTPANLGRARATLEWLGNHPDAGGPDVLLHGALVPGAVVGADPLPGRLPQPLLALDPEPLVGERAYDLALLALRLGRDPRTLARLLAAATGVDLERTLLWLSVLEVSRS